MDSVLDRTDIGQIGIVVKNLDVAMESYWRIAGIGPLENIHNRRPAAKLSLPRSSG